MFEAVNVTADPLYSGERIIRRDPNWEEALGVVGVTPLDYQTQTEKQVQAAISKGGTKFKRASVYWDTGAPLVNRDLRHDPARPKEVFGETDFMFVRSTLNNPNASIEDLAVANSMKAGFGVPVLRGRPKNIVYETFKDPHFKPWEIAQCNLDRDAKPYSYIELFQHGGVF